MSVKPAFNISDMQFQGSLQQNQPVSDGAGGEVDNWVTLLTTRVSLVKRTGRLSNGMGKMEYQREYTLTCRYQPGITLDPDTRWLINGIQYKIEDHERVDMTPHLLIMYVTKNG